MEKTKKINKSTKELFEEAVEKKRKENSLLIERQMKMQEQYQHWLWKQLEIQEVLIT